MMILKTHNPIRHRSPLFFTVLLVLSTLLGACQPTPLPASVQDEVIVSEIRKLTRKVDKIQFIKPSAELSKLEHKTTPVASNTFSHSPTQAPAEIELTDQPEALLSTPNPASIISTSKHLPTRYRARIRRYAG